MSTDYTAKSILRPKEKDHDSNRRRSLSASNIEHVGVLSESSQLQEEVITMRNEMAKLVTEKKVLNSKMGELMAASKEVKEKAELMSAEKKTRQYVRFVCIEYFYTCTSESTKLHHAL